MSKGTVNMERTMRRASSLGRAKRRQPVYRVMSIVEHDAILATLPTADELLHREITDFHPTRLNDRSRPLGPT